MLSYHIRIPHHGRGTGLLLSSGAFGVEVADVIFVGPLEDADLGRLGGGS